jgi:hypothetical protein
LTVLLPTCSSSELLCLAGWIWDTLLRYSTGGECFTYSAPFLRCTYREAKAVLRKRKYQENLLASTEAQITNIGQLVRLICQFGPSCPLTRLAVLCDAVVMLL